MHHTRHDDAMRHAIDIARTGIRAGQSPFGAAITAPDGELVCATHNSVRLTNDITAHAEINVLRAACAQLKTIDLSGHFLYTTCEPCPMCAAAIHWARIHTVVYGAAIADAAQAGFNELHIACTEMYQRGGSSVKVIAGVRSAECAALFHEWLAGANSAPY